MKTFGDLQTLITALIERDDLATLIPEFVAMFESDLQSELFDSQELVAQGVLTTTAGEALALISGLHVIKSISYQGCRLNHVQDLVPDTSLGRPTAFAIAGNQTIRLYPTPDAGYSLDVVYTPIISPLLMGGTLDNTAESWLLTQWPNLYVYGVLATIYNHLNDDAKLLKYTQLYADAVFKFRRVTKGGTPVAVNDLPL